jgi:hypothetical protein
VLEVGSWNRRAGRGGGLDQMGRVRELGQVEDGTEGFDWKERIVFRPPAPTWTHPRQSS